MKVLVLDNYDSFTYNIVHILRELGDLDISVIIKNPLVTKSFGMDLKKNV